MRSLLKSRAGESLARPGHFGVERVEGDLGTAPKESREFCWGKGRQGVGMELGLGDGHWSATAESQGIVQSES